ncbi:MAG: hypothetical protein Q8P30_03685 [Candidatus Uhrbacteria bacterium]|nr:hypothetical protein [Candidatus Uhrbacteria bacterium]
MKQSIVALIRPKLNLAQKEDQAAHLIEHLLDEPKRLKALGITNDFYAQNIIYHCGLINDFYMLEYSIVKSEVADNMAETLLEHKNELYIDQDDYKKVKSTLIEELHENRGEFVDVGEQLAKAIYTPSSPSVQNTRNNIESIIDLSCNQAVEIFKEYNTDLSLLKLSFDSTELDRLPIIEKNELRQEIECVELDHPWQSPDSMDTFILTSLPEKPDLLISRLYRRSLTDSYFGLLYDELRTKQGLVYNISVDADHGINTFEIYFASTEANSDKIVSQIKNTLIRYDSFIKDNLDYIKERVKLDLQLEWGDIQNQSYGIVDEIVSGGFIGTPSSLIKRIETITLSDLTRLNQLFLNLLQDKPLLIRRRHGKSPATEIVK